MDASGLRGASAAAHEAGGEALLACRILRLGVVRDPGVLRGLRLRYLDAGDLAGEGGEWAGARELGPLEGEREQGLQRGAVEVLEHVEPAAPVGQVEVADDAGELDAVVGLAGRALVEALEPRP